MGDYPFLGDRPAGASLEGYLFPDTYFLPRGETPERIARALVERFLEATGNHRRCNILYDPSHFLLQQLDYVQFIDFYHERIKMFHVKDAEFNPSGKSGVYGGYQGWQDRAESFYSSSNGNAGSTEMTKTEAYQILGVTPDASREEILESWRRLIKRVHPDSGGSALLAAKINTAKSILLDE